ncbi:hypothetical protein [Bdellovibrio sp. NC01]|uniref:hypothetical protein n=1 Tax=Bdellovibrio sp. NC01 TaxID=2220073 RepID=UPI00115B306E|nr:hypothetical protein [Bdellovibrio sp. NC01]QDK38712.1 hypothetical protein DOE51_14520 [Bdellovibrio sp. NC01]
MFFRKLFFCVFLVCGSFAAAAVSFHLTSAVENFSFLNSLNSGRSLYEKYGGYQTIKKIVDDTGAALLLDPVTAPFLLSGSTSEADSFDRVLSCLDQQFSSLMGGPYNYPDVSYFRGAPNEGYSCYEIKSLQSNFNLSPEVYDRFMVILIDVLRSNGVSNNDVKLITEQMNLQHDDLVGL